MHDAILHTSFGCIRPYREEDSSALVKYGNNRNVWLYLRDGFPHPYMQEDARRFLSMVAQKQPQTFFAIATQEEAIGGIGIVLSQDVHRLTAELGYWLGEPFWGRGIMSEAVRAFTDWCFNQFDLVRIHADPYATNRASVRVLEKAGFEFEGRLRCSVIKDGRILDQVLLSRIKAGFSAQEDAS